MALFRRTNGKHLLYIFPREKSNNVNEQFQSLVLIVYKYGQYFAQMLEKFTNAFLDYSYVTH